MNLGPAELLIVLAIVLLIFGGAQLPKLAHSIRRAHNELREGFAENGTHDDPATVIDERVASQ